MEGATGCLRAARFARNFFEKSFESLPRMIQSSTRLGGGHFFFSKQRSWWLPSAHRVVLVSYPAVLLHFITKV